VHSAISFSGYAAVRRQQFLPVKTIEIEGSEAYHLTGVAKGTVLLSAMTQRELLETGLLPNITTLPPTT
jgi:hypothetical protein